MLELLLMHSAGQSRVIFMTNLILLFQSEASMQQK